MASSSANRAVILREYAPTGLPEPGKHFTVDNVDEPGALGDGEVTVQLKYISVDPYLRGRMKDRESYFPAFEIGQPGANFAVFEVVASKSAAHPVGSTWAGTTPWVLRQNLSAEKLASVWRADHEGIPESASVGVLGMPGATAYFGYLELCAPKEGETLVVSGAAGAVGSIVVQLGKIRGCRVIGIAGSDEKCAFLKSIGADVALNYKHPNLEAAIREAAPKGVDQYFDNTGGDIKDAVYANLNSGARVSACGAISGYNLAEAPIGRTWEWTIVTKQIRIEGFLCFRWITQWPKAFSELAQWIREGKIKYEETIEHGFENIIPAFNKMMQGDNTGKMVIYV